METGAPCGLFNFFVCFVFLLFSIILYFFDIESKFDVGMLGHLSQILHNYLHKLILKKRTRFCKGKLAQQNLKKNLPL